MFAGALNPTGEIVSRLNRWADALWPAHGRVGDRRDVVVWHTADRGLLPVRQLETENTVLAVDGCLWSREQIPTAPEEAAQTLRELATTVAEDTGWPLPEPWDGSFATVLYNRGQRTLSLAVDAVGLRRLFYGRRGESVVFASTQAACAYALELEPDLCGLLQWLASGSILGRRTVFAGLTEILPGERVRLGASGEHIDSAFDQPWHRDVRRLGPEEAAEKLAPLVARQTRRYAEGDHVGLALSAGLDSRLVLGALGDRAESMNAYTFGDPAEYEVELSRRIAAVARLEHRIVDLTGRFFPAEADLRRQALLCEAASYPFWLATGEAVRRDDVRTLLMGDITDCLQVRIGPLWDRRQRVRLRLRGLLGRDEIAETDTREPEALEAWDQDTRSARSTAARHLAHHLGVEVDREDIEAAVDQGFEEIHQLIAGGATPSLFQLQERFHLTTVRQGVGTQAVSLSPEIEIFPAFATREVITAALDVSIETRAWRDLLDALGRRLLSPKLRRIPTATIPFVAHSSPKAIQEAVWLARWLGDSVIRRLNKSRLGAMPRERCVKTLRLQPEYALAERGFYGSPWALAGGFSSDYYVDRVRRTARWEKPALLPQNELRAVSADAILAAARVGPAYLKDLTAFERH